jgi:hypothetical protein
MRARLTIICLLFAAVSCPIAYADNSTEYADIHVVGVISRIGDALTIKRVGSTVFTNSEQSLLISDWGIDRMITGLIVEALSPRFTVKPIDATSLQSSADIKTFIQGLPPESVSDAYIVISKSQGQDLSSNQYLSGLGLYRHDLILGGHRYGIYAYYQVSVIDAKTGKIIDYGTSRLNDGGVFNSQPPFLMTEAENWSDTPDAMTETQRQAIKMEMTQLIQTSVPHTLRTANLLPKVQAK